MKEEFKCSSCVFYKIILPVFMPLEMKFLPVRLQFIMDELPQEVSVALATLVEVLRSLKQDMP